jgi:GNAT superfamily N-acetyltransferase
VDGLRLRWASTADTELAFQIKQSQFRSYAEMLKPWDEAAERRLHQERFAVQDFRFVVVEGDDIGVLATRLWHDCLKIYQLFIVSAHQGKGIGAWCLEKVSAEAGEAGVPLRLRVLKVNVRALNFYQRFGFKLITQDASHTYLEYEL